MGKSDLYKVKVKSGRNFIEIQGDKKFTEGMFSQIAEIFPKAGKKPLPKKRGRKPNPKPKVDLDTISAEDLLKKIDGKKSSTTILVSGFILNKKLRKREFRSKEMESFMNDNKIDVPKNITYHFRNLKDSGHFIQGRKQGRFKITDVGIKYIENLL